ncbi:MAG: MOSC domain-containing protein [Acidimicrobiales bacterium]
MDPMDLQVAQLWRFPVKSMGGEQVDECPLAGRGLRGDRGYALVDRTTGRVASAKDPRKWAGLLQMAARYVDQPSGGRQLPPVTITFADGSSVRSDAPGIDATLSQAVGREVSLSSEPGPGAGYDGVWPLIDGLAPDRFIESSEVGRTDDGEPVLGLELGGLATGTFLDVAPVHVLATATLDDLAVRNPGASYDRRRFRANVVLSGAPSAFVENDWVGRSMAIGDAEITVAMATMRCVMTTLAQTGLERDRRTLQGIAAHNRVEIPGLGTWACVGAYATVSRGGTVRIGDRMSLSA